MPANPASPAPGPLGHAFVEGWTGFEGKPQDRCYRVVSPAIENGKYDIRCGYGRDAHLPLASESLHRCPLCGDEHRGPA